MNSKIYGLNTSFDGKKMIQTLSSKLEIIADFGNATIDLLSEGEKIESLPFGKMTLSDYERHLSLKTAIL